MRSAPIRTVLATVVGVVAAVALSPHAVAASAGTEHSDSHSLARLHAIKAQLDRAETPPVTVTSWYVDVDTNTVVVETLPGAGSALTEFIEASGVAEELVRVEPASGRPRLLQPWPLREGDPYFVGGARCTVGFLVRTTVGDNGFVTAGHCGDAGSSTLGYNQQPQGTFEISIFPRADWALVIVNDNWIPTPMATGSLEAPIGGSVCKIGSTTGVTCGVITARNVTVNYPQGTVTSLTKTTICAEPGDSGAPVFAGTQGQGLVSGGSGNCATGGITFFQPLNPILWSASLLLLTA